MLFPTQAGAGAVREAGAVTASSTLTTLTANVSANTKATSWTELSSALPHETAAVIVQLDPSDGVSYLIDLAIGGSGSEVAVVDNLLTASGKTGSFIGGTNQYILPIALPVGARLSARCQASTGSATVTINTVLIAPSAMLPAGFRRCTTYGADTSSSQGTTVDPGGSANTKGAVAPISASTTNPCRAIVFGMASDQIGGTWAGMTHLTDILVGPSSNEIVTVPNLFHESTGQETWHTPAAFPYPVDIPAGSRISAQDQASGTNATDRTISVILLGFD